MNGVTSAATPNGRIVVAVGGDANFDQLAVAATDPATGRELYRREFFLGGGIPFLASSAVTPSGHTLVATGTLSDGSVGSRALTVGIDVDTGRLTWTRLSPERSRNDGSAGVAIDPSGQAAYVGTWIEEDKDSYTDDLVAEKVDVTTGRVIWTSRVGRLDHADEFPIGVSFAGGRVVVAAETQMTTQGVTGDYDFFAYVFDPGRGRLLGQLHWGSGFGDDWAGASATSRDHRFVAISGYGPADPTGQTTDVTTMLIDPARMRVVWTVHTSGPGADTEAWTVAFSNDGVVVGASSGPARADIPAPYVAAGGSVGHQATAVTLDLRTGAQKWRRDVTDPAGATSWIAALAVAPDGKTIYWTGFSSPAVAWGWASTPALYAWPSSPDDALVLAMGAGDGTLQWSSRWNPQPEGLGSDFMAAPVATSRGLVVSGAYDLMDPAHGSFDYSDQEGVTLRFAP